MDAVCIFFVCLNDEVKVNVLLNDISCFNVVIMCVKKKLIFIGNVEMLRFFSVFARAFEFYRVEGWIVSFIIEVLDFMNFVFGMFELSVF